MVYLKAALLLQLCLFEQVFQCLLFRCNAMGVKVLYKIGGKLIGECTRRPSSFVITEWLFADDEALICTSRSDMVIAARVYVFHEVTTEFGLILSIDKMKLLELILQIIT